MPGGSGDWALQLIYSRAIRPPSPHTGSRGGRRGVVHEQAGGGGGTGAGWGWYRSRLVVVQEQNYFSLFIRGPDAWLLFMK